MKILGNLTAIGSGLSQIQGQSIVTEIKDGVIPSTIVRRTDLIREINNLYNSFLTYAQNINFSIVALSGYFYNLIQQYHPSGIPRRLEYIFNGNSGVQIINHSLGNMPFVEMLENNSVVIPESVEHIDENATKISFMPSNSGIYKIIILG